MSPDGRTVVGPGAVDMKGGIVIAINGPGGRSPRPPTARELDLGWTVLLNSDEETGSFGSNAALCRRGDAATTWASSWSRRFPAARWPSSARGSGQFMVEVFGRAAHAGREFTNGRQRGGDLLAEVIQKPSHAAVPCPTTA